MKERKTVTIETAQNGFLIFEGRHETGYLVPLPHVAESWATANTIAKKLLEGKNTPKS